MDRIDRVTHRSYLSLYWGILISPIRDKYRSDPPRPDDNPLIRGDLSLDLHPDERKSA